ncbi:MAG: hypothetical protein GIW99_02575 [Candidatus Eremiobacteraeota bacterium]|nr:hypothetical protein [Candidatus Eremiobacteraeota bacterium]MBC5826559.1 hypothetical protein [Candidatus Eremiobacteraeota bacterium]
MPTAAKLAAGLSAGAVATYALGLVHDAIYRREDESVHRREAVLEDHTAPQALGEKLLRLFGERPSEAEIEAAGKVIHWAFGISSGLAYSIFKERSDGGSPLLGVPFGLALYVLHLFGVPALKLSPPSRRFPLQTAVRGLAYHLAYGAVLGLTYGAFTQTKRR